jgi:cobaltochelatase CobT
LRARDLPAAFAADDLSSAKGWLLRDPAIWHRKADAAKKLFDAVPAADADSLRAAFATTTPGDWAICILVDQSGSMRDDPILHTAAAVRWLSAILGDIGATVTLLGFSTMGWHGWKSRQDWLSNGQPQRPGRLCALLHILYQRAGEPLGQEDWAVMLHPDILRENVDGEAIEWARAMLREQSQPHKLLVILSDGAPVDDSTLMQNGPSYLERHLQSVIQNIEASDDMILAALGIGYDVSRYYHRSRSVDTLDVLPGELAALIAQTVRAKTEDA